MPVTVVWEVSSQLSQYFCQQLFFFFLGSFCVCSSFFFSILQKVVLVMSSVCAVPLIYIFVDVSHRQLLGFCDYPDGVFTGKFQG